MSDELYGTVTIDEDAIQNALDHSSEDHAHIREVLAKALELKGLNADDVAALMRIQSQELEEELFETARKAKMGIYGRRLVLFAPLYVSNLCANDCTYCAFRSKNKAVKRRALSQEEVAEETRIIINQGHKRILLVAGESYPREGIEYAFKCIDTIYNTKSEWGEVRRINVNLAPLTLDEFQGLKDRRIGTYQLFQETYHRDTYSKVHLSGKKRDFDWRITAMDRAMLAGIDDVGIGVLFGLYDWRFELLALLQHNTHLEERFGVGCHTISVPRIEPAVGSDLSEHPPVPVSDKDFRKLIAILRLTVPYTGIILSTRENPEMRREALALGVSQISAGSRTNPGGYHEESYDMSQFSLGDHRSLDEVVEDIAHLGYIPSFCTGCYRLGRTGKDFMDLAKPGLIKHYCEINALSTFAEFLEHFASPATQEVGNELIDRIIEEQPPTRKERASTVVRKVRAGDRDVYV
ncbi:MAG TPA: [FeFe] hydrogenase H-cluster radical SAM maturase HydG [Candidatus Hydrogenedentes bacterium]|mgnify:FL=1|nr:[FeFe] hydrogenase H-cluster radical SAM maturase HydG [Candidatus Hydrogenedentota bacterium]